MSESHHGLTKGQRARQRSSGHLGTVERFEMAEGLAFVYLKVNRRLTVQARPQDCQPIEQDSD